MLPLLLSISIIYPFFAFISVPLTALFKELRSCFSSIWSFLIKGTYTFLSQISFLTLNRFIVSITLFEQWNTFEFITKNPVPGCMPVFSRNLLQSFFHHTLKSRHKKLWYCTDWRMEMPPKLMPDQVPFDSMFRPHRLLSYDSNSVLLISEQHAELPTRWYWHFVMDSHLLSFL